MRWMVSVNGGDPEQVEADDAVEAATKGVASWKAWVHERREVELLIVHRAERVVIPRPPS